MIRILAAAFAVAVVAFIASGFLTSGERSWRAVQSAPITASRITADDFPLSSDILKSGKLRLVGGLVLRSSNPHFGALSGLRISNDGTLTAVTDTGFWFRGKIERDGQGLPTGIAKGRMAPLLDGDGRPFSQKWFGDAEGLTFKDGKAYVSTEQDARVLEYNASDDLLTSSSKVYGPPLPGNRLPYNRGLEAVATILPHFAPYGGRVLAIAETAPEDGTAIRGFLMGDQSVEEIDIVQRNGFAITDADITSSGHLVLLERKFNPNRGPQLRLRQIDWLAQKKSNTPLDGKIILDLDNRWQIDNMEGLSVFSGPEGKRRVGLVSDNNKWPLQRSLYLEFAYDEPVIHGSITTF